jgi:pyruvate formate lyase activating enzyme
VPLHFTAFHPDYKMMDTPPTPAATLRRAREIALDNGLRHVYVGNIADREAQTTYCRSCGSNLIERSAYDIVGWGLGEGGGCRECGTTLSGVFEANPGTWGTRRQPVSLGSPSW